MQFAANLATRPAGTAERQAPTSSCQHRLTRISVAGAPWPGCWCLD